MFLVTDICVLVAYDRENATPDFRCQISVEMIRHDANYFILNIVWGVAVFFPSLTILKEEAGLYLLV